MTTRHPDPGQPDPGQPAGQPAGQPGHDPLARGGRRPAFQPADPEDLRIHPPAGPACLAVRHRLRDYVEGEVEPAGAAEIEQHVHACRSCALGLARSEAEQLQLREALALQLPAPGRSFTASVVGRARALLEAEQRTPPVGFTQRVMARVREEALAELVSRAVAPRRSLLAAAALVLGLLAGTGVFYGLGSAPELVQVEQSADAVVWRGGVAELLSAQTVLHDGDELRTSEAGLASLRWAARPVAAGGAAGAHQLRLYESTRVRLRAAEPWSVDLLEGEIEVETPAGIDVRIADGTELALAAGHYGVVSRPVYSQDWRDGSRVQVAVHEGLATVIRGGQHRPVASGQLAEFDSFSGIVVDQIVDVAMLRNSRERGTAAITASHAVAPADADATFFGVLIDPRSEQPLADATVTIDTWLGTQTVHTDAAGRFEIGGLDRLTGQFAIIAAVPPATASGLWGLRPTVTFLDGRSGLRRFTLMPAHTWSGRLHDGEQRPVPGAWLQACLVDEVLGRVERVGPLQQLEGDRFELAGLPAELGPHESLLLIAGAPERLPRVVLARTAVRPEDAALAVSLEAFGEDVIGGFPAAAELELGYEIVGLPVALARIRRTSDANGRVELPRTAGHRYLLHGDAAPQRIVRTADGQIDLVEVAGLQHAEVRAGTGSAAVLWGESAGVALARIPSAPDGGLLSVHAAGSQQACPGARIYHGESGQWTLLGVYDGRAPLRCVLPEGGQLVAITPEGQVAAEAVRTAAGRTHRSLAARRPGKVLVTAAVELLLFRAGDGLPDVLRQASGAGEWVLRAGRYEVLPGGAEAGEAGAAPAGLPLTVPMGGSVSLPPAGTR